MKNNEGMETSIFALKKRLSEIPNVVFLDRAAVETALAALNSFFFENMKISPSFLDHLDPETLSSCGRVFEKGDIIYRCKDCTHDDTCVLCSSCFQESDHVGHRIHFTISNGTGGSCDCGEDESWNRPLSCPKHQTVEVLNSKTTELEAFNQATQSFFAALFAHCLPFWTKDLCSSPTLNPEGALILFNDERHSFDEVISILINSHVVSAGDISKAHSIATLVDTHVFNIESSDTDDLGIRLHQDWPG